MYKALKWIRVGVAITFILLISLHISFAIKFQFVPSMLSFLAGGALIFIFFLLMTLLFGRVYCSWICPLGIYQDVISRIARLFKSKKQRKMQFHKPHNILRYTIAIVVFCSTIIGFTYPLIVFDPYSNYGRISTHLFDSAIQGSENLLSTLFPAIFSYSPFTNFALGSFIYALLFFLIITVMAALRGRLYCNTICPVGTLMGLISKVSLFKISMDPEMCVGCNLCANSCKSECIDVKNRTIDESRCVACLDCTINCKRSGIKYRLRWKKNGIEKEGRREAIATLMGVGAVVSSRGFTKNENSAPKEITGIVPPGGIGIEHLKDCCTACHECIAACPNGIIKPAIGEYGLSGLLLPTLSYQNQFCGFECNTCSNVCPNGALMPLTLKAKRRTQIGQVEFIAKNCIVFRHKTDCGACDEHCPTKAITMKEWAANAGLRFPTVNKDICIGCGGCEYVCPATPKAMIIRPLVKHGHSQAPTVDKQEEKSVTDFGF